MSNPYLDDQPTPQPVPAPSPSGQPLNKWQWLLVVGIVAGLLLPPSGGWGTLPIPAPFNDTKPDAAKTDGSWVIVVEQTENRTPATATLMRDLPFWQSLVGRGLNWRHYDYDADEAAVYREKADEVGLPAVLIIGVKTDPPGKLLGSFPLPASKDELDAKIKEATGR